ncbi:hypothetical protein CK203_060936 [Vitis vinifera]|uniref:Uncharacterized protein n=1 Tax=Vitis vinifera TaxID=29760 RepID=A0A438GGP8_VITVI|nr:hypothetical protein CK203_060936 [Vitis vinifera]
MHHPCMLTTCAAPQATTKPPHDPSKASVITLPCSIALIVASLTARSHKEDRFGVAQLSGSNAAVISTLLSCLLAVETFLGKKTSLQSPNALMGPAGIKWATVATARSDAATMLWEMLTGAKAGLLEKDWIIGGKPLYEPRTPFAETASFPGFPSLLDA